MTTTQKRAEWLIAHRAEIEAARTSGKKGKMSNIHAVNLGRHGGRSKSPAKQAAARRNGRRGGRPPKRAT